MVTHNHYFVQATRQQNTMANGRIVALNRRLVQPKQPALSVCDSLLDYGTIQPLFG